MDTQYIMDYRAIWEARDLQRWFESVTEAGMNVYVRAQQFHKPEGYGAGEFIQYRLEFSYGEESFADLEEADCDFWFSHENTGSDFWRFLAVAEDVGEENGLVKYDDQLLLDF